MIEYNEITWENDTGHPLSADNLNRFERLLASVVSEINNFHKHWWRKSKVSGGKIEVLEGNTYYYTMGGAGDTVDVWYSDSATPCVDDNGDIYVKLDNPSSITFSYNNISSEAFNDDILNQKYFMVNKKEGVEVLIGNGVIGQNVKHGSPNRFGFSINSKTVNLVRVYGYDRAEYVNSEDAGAYPNGWSDEDVALYEYLGIPFENSRDAKLNQG